jgi:hypothetical protein
MATAAQQVDNITADFIGPMDVMEAGSTSATLDNDGDEPFDDSPYNKADDTLEAVVAEMRNEYDANLAQGLYAGMGVAASLSLKGRDNCLVLIYEGASGHGKSIVVRALGPATKSSPTHKMFERVDKFTPASFVSNSSKHSAQQLDEIDLLPRIKDKVMLTKELSPLFADDDKALRQSFGTLTTVLDGNGFVTNSGTHGKRSYDGDFLFNWIGATTPVKAHVHELMSQLGNRMLFYEIPSRDATEEELMEDDENVKEKGKAMRFRVNRLLAAHFDRHPVNSVDPESIKISEVLKRRLVRWAKFIVHGRVSISPLKKADRDDPDEFEVGDREGAYRVKHLLMMLAKGCALAANRDYVSESDLDIIAHIAMSSLPPRRRKLFRAMNEGSVTSTDVARLEGITKPTALARMKEMAATGLCLISKGSGKTADALTLAPEWKWSTEHIESWARSTGSPGLPADNTDDLSEGLLEATGD